MQLLWLAVMAFRTPEEINADIEELAVSRGYRLETLGHSVGGVAILGLRAGTADLPGVRIVGGHHGDEPASIDIVLEIARQIPLGARHVLFVPMVNPDGYRAHTRFNANGVDLNRNYGYEYRREFSAGEHAYSEPETRALALDNEYHRYGLSLTYHTGAFNIGYPYNYTTAPMSEEPLLQSFGQRYRDLVGGSFELLRGATWYISYGDLNDYSLGYYGAADFTVELVQSKQADPPQWQEQINAAIDFASREQRIVQTLDEDGLPLAAFVQTATVTARADAVRGLALLVEPGDYTISYPGYVGSVPTESSLRARSLVTPFSAGAGEVLTHARGDFAGMRAIKAGSDTVVFACEIDCSAAAPSRPGHYDIVVTFEDGAEGVVRNALLVREQDGTRVTEEGNEYLFDGEAWLVERGKGARLFNGRIAKPDTRATVDIAWMEDGAFVAQTVSGADGPSPDPSSGGRKGCQSSGSAGLFAIVLLLRSLRPRRV